jgi:hypothetical protein
LEIPDYLYPVFGTFDIEFTRPPAYGDAWGQSARFTNVHAWAGNPLTASAPIDLDSALNLSGLDGNQLPVASPFDVYRFTGNTSDGSAVTLTVSLPGLQAFPHGGTTAPSDQPHNVVYELNAHARQRPFADFSEDDAIDKTDLAAWSAGFGSAMSGAVDTLSHGDANGDNAVDGADFLAWQQQLGQTTATASTAAVPEPTTIMLCITFGVAGFLKRKKKAARE